MANQTNRRRLLSSAVAVIAGSGITAGAAASVADYLSVAAPEPDAELIATCAAFNKREKEVSALLRLDEERGYALHDAYHPAQSAAVERMCNLPCTTRQGQVALAESLLAWDAEIFIEEDDPNADTNDRLVAALVRSLLPGRA